MTTLCVPIAALVVIFKLAADSFIQMYAAAFLRDGREHVRNSKVPSEEGWLSAFVNSAVIDVFGSARWTHKRIEGGLMQIAPCIKQDLE